MKSEIPYFFEFIIVILVGACVFNPACSAFGVLVIATYKIADKYFTRNLSDADRADIQQVKATCAEIKKIQDRAGLSKAFRQE